MKTEQEAIKNILGEIFKNSKEYFDHYITRDNYLNLPKGKVIDLIATSAISLKRKCEMYKELAYFESAETRKRAEELFIELSAISRWVCTGEEVEIYRLYELILNDILSECNVKENEMLLIREQYRESQETYSFPVKSFKEMEERLIEDYELSKEEICEAQKENGTWIKAEKYRVNEKGEYEEVLSFIMLELEPVWFTYGKKKGPRFRTLDFFQRFGCEELESPFLAGDIIKVDIRPFAPICYGIVLTNFKDRDLEPWVLIIRGDGTCNLGGYNYRAITRGYNYETPEPYLNSNIVKEEDFPFKDRFVWLSSFINRKNENGAIIDKTMCELEGENINSISIDRLISELKEKQNG